MSTHANQSNCSANRASSVRDVVTFREIVSIGGTGAPYISGDGYSGQSDDPGITISRTSAGLYALTYPKGKQAWITVDIISAALTVVGTVTTAKSATAGTASITTLAGSNAAAATDPANGDKLMITITVER